MPKIVQYIFVLGCLLALASANSNSPTRTGYPRPNRGFKSQGLSTARGFGKRDPNLGQGTLMGSPGIGSLSSNSDGFLPMSFESRASYPNSWLVEELQSNPDAAKIIVEKIIDENGDGEITPDELYRRIYY